MHRLFGRAKATPAAAPAPSLTEHITKLEDKGVSLEAKISDCDRQLMAIKQQLAKCKTPAQQAPLKQRAMAILKRKKMYENQRDGMMQRAFNMEQTQFAIDGMKEAKEHVEVMKAGMKDMKAMMGDMDLGEIEDLSDDMADMLADTNEINELLARSYDTYDTVDEKDLDAELAGLDDELGLDDASAVGAGASATATGASASAVGTDDGLAAYLAPSFAPSSATSAAAYAPAPSSSAGAFPAVPTGALPASKTPMALGTAARF